MPHNKRWWLLGLAALFFAVTIPSGWLWNITRPVIHKDIINRYAGMYKFDPLFIMALVKVESSFRKSARSPRGAIGLMQLMPDTAREMAVRTRLGDDVPLEQLEEPETNLRLGVHYLSLLREEFGTDTVAVLAAYNAGPANARAWRGNGSLNADRIPYPETRQFVTRVLDTQLWLKRLQKVKKTFRA